MTPKQEREITQLLLERTANVLHWLSLLRARRPASAILAAADADAALVLRRLRQFEKALPKGKAT